MRYRTLARRKFLYAILPPIPNSLSMKAGHLSSFPDIRFFSFTISLARMALIGDTRAARLAEPAAERYTVAADSAAPSSIAHIEIPKTSRNSSASSTRPPTAPTSTAVAAIPLITPRGTPTSPSTAAS